MSDPKKHGLGRGLSALLGEAPRTVAAGEDGRANGVQSIAIARIHANPGQPRKQFDEVSLNELAQSIADKGVLSLVKTGDADAARELARISLSLAASQTARQPRIFWKIASGYFEALAQGLLPWASTSLSAVKPTPKPNWTSARPARKSFVMR